MPPTILEPRFFPRVPADVPVLLRAHDFVFGGTLRNVSEGGALVETSEYVAADTHVHVQFPLSPSGRPIAAAGVVRRLGLPGDAPGPLVAVSFEQISEEAVLAIRAFVASKEPMEWSGADESRVLPEEVAKKFIPLVRSQANRLKRSTGVPPEELVGAGFVALVEAYRRYDPRRCHAFQPFALMRIRGAMMDELRRLRPSSRTLRERGKDLEALAKRLSNGAPSLPTDAELAAAMDMSLADYHACVASLSGVTPTLVEWNEELHAADVVETPDAHLEHARTRRLVSQAIDALPERLRSVLTLHFDGELTLTAIGSILGVTQSRASQLLSEGLSRVREAVGSGERGARLHRQPAA